MSYYRKAACINIWKYAQKYASFALLGPMENRPQKNTESHFLFREDSPCLVLSSLLPEEADDLVMPLQSYIYGV